MPEALGVFALVAVLAVAGLVLPQLPPDLVVTAGWICTAVGLGVGVPTGFWYHVRLRGCLGPRGELPRHWWLRPTELHSRLREDERAGVLLWFAIGGAGFVGVVIGCLLVGFGVVLQGFRAGVF